MENLDDNKESNGNKPANTPMIVGLVLVTLLILSWAVSTFFGFTFVKALAGVIIVLFGVAVAIFMTGMA